MGPTKEEINKYLTQKKGQCWHEYYPYQQGFGSMQCIKCRSFKAPEDFFTWDGMGNLITWAKRQEFWRPFVSYNHKKLEKVLGPEEFTPLLYNFLKRRRGWN